MIKKIHAIYQQGDTRGFVQRIIRYIPSHQLIKSNDAKRCEYGLNCEKRDYRIIVSLTSFPARLCHLHMCLKSLLFQTVKPDRIVVWFGNDVTKEMLTEEMSMLEEYGVEYQFDSQRNIMPHKKYWYAMQEEPDSIVITVDDDAIYSPRLIQSLMQTHKKYPDCVCARRVHKITKTKDGKIAPYKSWIHECMSVRKPSQHLLAVGVGGVLYPGCKSLDAEAFNVDAFTELCPRTDDIWLKCMEVMNGTKVVWSPCLLPHPASLEGIESLNDSNVLDGKNDLCIHAVIERYDMLKEEMFI